MHILNPAGRVVGSFKDNKLRCWSFEEALGINPAEKRRARIEEKKRRKDPDWQPEKKTPRRTVGFTATEAGKYTLKYRLCYESDDDFYNLSIATNENAAIDAEKSRIRVYSLLGVSKDGALFKGEKRKEKALEYINHCGH